MKRFLKFKKLSQRGIVHHLAPILVVVLLGATTTGFVMLRSKAATAWSGSLQVGPSGSGFCLNAPVLAQGQPVKLDTCGNKINQKWQLVVAGTVTGDGKTVRIYNIETFASGINLCVDDYKTSTAQGRNNPLVLWKCATTDKAQQWLWAGDGHQLKNNGASLLAINQQAQCMDNQSKVLKVGNPVDLYHCKVNSAKYPHDTDNQDWFEIANSATASSPVSRGNPTPPPPSGVTTNPGPVNTSPGVQNWHGALQLGLDRTLCLDGAATQNAKGHQEVVIAKCTNSVTQNWQRVPIDSRMFMLKAASGACLNDTANGVGTSATNRVYAQTYPCNSADRASTWIWAKAGVTGTDNTDRHELMNVYSAGCVNDPANSKAPATQQIIFSCASNSSNEQWFEASL